MANRMWKAQSGAQFIGVDQCSTGRSSNLLNASLQCPKGSSETRAGNRVHNGRSNGIQRSTQDQKNQM